MQTADKPNPDANRVIEHLLNQIRQLHLALALADASIPLQSVEQEVEPDD